MNHKRKIVLGLVPTRRDVSGEFFCSIEVALNRKRAVEKKLKDMKIDFINIDFLNEEGLIRKGLDAQKIVDHFNSKGVDAIFCPFVNFGTEDAIAKIGKLLGKPLLLWGPRDDAPDADGNRCTDTQCGLFAAGKVLRQFGVPFTYVTNCSLDDPIFERTLNNFLAAAQVVKSFQHMRIGQIGVRPETFWSVKCNEIQLLEKFGVEVVPITMIELQNIFNDFYQNRKHELLDIVQKYKKNFLTTVNDDFLLRTAALNRAIRSWADENELDAAASSCWGAMRQIGGIASCFTFGELTDEKLPVACEVDIHGAITSIMAQASTGWTKSSFLADLTIRHPTNDNAELFWHCGVFPGSTASKAHKPEIGNNFDEGRPTVGNFRIADGDVTLCRFDCSNDQYQLLMMEGKTVDGPATSGTYGWIEFKDWPKIEHKIVTGPYIHHCAGVHARTAPVLYEACKYIPGLIPDPVEPSKEEILASLR